MLIGGPTLFGNRAVASPIAFLIMPAAVRLALGSNPWRTSEPFPIAVTEPGTAAHLGLEQASITSIENPPRPERRGTNLRNTPVGTLLSKPTNVTSMRRSRARG